MPRKAIEHKHSNETIKPTRLKKHKAKQSDEDIKTTPLKSSKSNNSHEDVKNKSLKNHTSNPIKSTNKESEKSSNKPKRMVINLGELNNFNEKKIARLSNFFESQVAEYNKRVWHKGKIYRFEDGTEFTFKHDVFQRPCKNKGEVRYEVISNKEPIGKGGFGEVKRIKGTLVLEEANFKRSNEKERVVKIQQHNEINTLQALQKEYILSKKAAHLSVKKPTIYMERTSYTAMRKVPGKNLYEILMDDFEGRFEDQTKPPLTVKQRIGLSKALLKALKEQVTDKGIVHRDIKPENILVDLNSPLAVNIIDYGISMKADRPDGRSAGTPAYAAPEAVDGLACAKSDVYSMGRILALLWGVDGTTYELESIVFDSSKILSTLFEGIELAAQDKQKITLILSGMLEQDPNKRMSITDAIRAFKTVGNTGLSHFFLNAVFEKTIELDGQLGLKAREVRQLNGKKISLTKRVAAIFDLCIEGQLGNISVDEALESIVNKARHSKKFQEHHFFNRQTPESQFYESILSAVSSVPEHFNLAQREHKKAHVHVKV
jgi:serine/threonine protein kinase